MTCYAQAAQIGILIATVVLAVVSFFYQRRARWWYEQADEIFRKYHEETSTWGRRV